MTFGVNTYLKPFTDALIDLIYPPVCAACGCETQDSFSPICEACLQALDLISDPICPKCGAPISESSTPQKRCAECPSDAIHFDIARSVLSYADERVKNLVHALKYQYRTRLAAPLGEFLLKGFQRHYQEMNWDAIVPVPLHKKKLREREFNQATLISKSLSNAHGIPLREDLIYRARNTPSQTTLDTQQRRQNPLNAFSPSRKNAALGLCLLVIDDVYTTGSTVNEVCYTLKQGGAAFTGVLTLARSL